MYRLDHILIFFKVANYHIHQTVSHIQKVPRQIGLTVCLVGMSHAWHDHVTHIQSIESLGLTV